MVSKGQFVGLDWNHIARLHSQVLAHVNSLTASCCHILKKLKQKLVRDSQNLLV